MSEMIKAYLKVVLILSAAAGAAVLIAWWIIFLSECSWTSLAKNSAGLATFVLLLAIPVTAVFSRVGEEKH